MPKLLLFAPCHRVAYDSADNVVSLLEIFQGFSISLVSGAQEQLKATDVSGEPLHLPIRWVVFTLWRRSTGDEGKNFTQICEMIHPDGKKQDLPQLPFEMSQTFQRNNINVQNFPAYAAGDYTLRLLLKENESEPVLLAEYPILVTHAVDASH